MSEAKEYLVQPVDKGTVNISEEVVAAIAALAISDVEGVFGLSSSFTADLAELLGTESMLTLVESYSGMIIYVPKLDSLLRNIRDRRIRQEYDGTNTRALALKYDVSESWVKRIASIDERGEIRGQTSLFDG